MGTATAPRVVTGHIGLNVSDLERSIAFYRQAFGFDELAVSADGAQRFAFLGFDSGPVLTLWEQSSGEFSAATPGFAPSVVPSGFRAAGAAGGGDLEATIDGVRTRRGCRAPGGRGLGRHLFHRSGWNTS